MPNSKIIYDGKTLIDISNDTVTPETLAEGVTAHNSQGEQITGTMQAGGGGEVGEQYINTSEMTDFAYFFAWSARKEYTFTVDTQKATTFKNIFLNVNGLYDYPQQTSLLFPCIILPSGNVEIFRGMFENCAYLKTVETFDTSKGTDFSNMFSGCKKLNSVGLLDTSAGTSFNSMFADCAALTAIPQLDTSKGTNFSYMFDACAALTAIPQLDTSKGTSFYSMFDGCAALTAIPQLDTSKGTNFSYMFDACKSLTTVSLTTAAKDFHTYAFRDCTALTSVTIGAGWAVSIYLNYSNNLTQESLHAMIENLADLTGQTAKTFKIGPTNVAKIDNEHIAMLVAKNWAYS